MITIKADNTWCHVTGAGRKTIRKIEKATSYFVSGYYFSPAYRSHRWDGKEHLLKYSAKHGYRFPLGLLEDVITTLAEWEIPYKTDLSARRKPKASVAYGWNPDVEMRPYQQSVIETMTKKGWNRGRGIVKMPIRSGKTKTAARIIHDLGVRTLFIVPSQMLLHQTRDALADALQVKVGIIGDGIWDEGDVTVATVQSLSAARDGRSSKEKVAAYKKLRTGYDCVVFDEAHHLRGEEWHAVMMGLDAYFKIGLSATVYFDSEREMEKGVIWLKACCGDMRVDISTSDLIEKGYLMKPDIRLRRVTKPDLNGHGWSKTLTNAAIFENEHRNQMVLSDTRYALMEGLGVLIVTNRLNQLERIAELLDGDGIEFEVITGKDPSEARKDKVARFVKGKVKVLMGTVFGEGVDIPVIECVINAEGGRDVKATVQRMRNLTPSPGKTTALFHDYIDLTNGYFAQHSKERIDAYRAERAFTVSIVE